MKFVCTTIGNENDKIISYTLLCLLKNFRGKSEKKIKKNLNNLIYISENSLFKILFILKW